MPLHNAIPLCSVKYVGDVFSGATFKYDTTFNISKHNGKKLAESERIIEIEKMNTKLIETQLQQIDKTRSQISLDVQDRLMDKSLTKLQLWAQYKLIAKPVTKMQLEVQDKRIKIERIKSLNIDFNFIIDKLRGCKPLCPREQRLNINEVMSLKSSDMVNVDYCESKECDNETLEINKLVSMNLTSDHSIMNKCGNVNLVIKRSHDINMNDSKDLNTGSTFNIGKSIGLSVNRDIKMSINKYESTALMDVISKNNIGMCSNYQNMNVTSEDIIDKDRSIRCYDKILLADGLSKTSSEKSIFRFNIGNINRDNSKKLFYNDSSILMDQYKSDHQFQKIESKPMHKKVGTQLMYVDTLTRADVMVGYKPLNMTTLKDIINSKESYLDRLNIKDVMKFNQKFVNRLHITNVMKLNEKYVDRIYQKDIFKSKIKSMASSLDIAICKERQKSIIDLSIENMYKERSKLLNGGGRDIDINNDFKFIDLTHRWWWLNETGPSDHLIVPNKDYAGMKDLLENNKNLYLRFTDHPIEWGNTWGIDTNIPPDAISIEIMTDLVNIITMIWHKNAQGWANVTGKEAIQLLMELLYDWYTMDSSKPNYSYYRAYRWIRWEAEKVYFLNTTHGLQAIGILVANLIDYLKIHHFNTVPIWKDVKAMDEGRNFNRKAQNDDLMRPLDKTKGKRHYLIDSQNYERKNKLRR